MLHRLSRTLVRAAAVCAVIPAISFAWIYKPIINQTTGRLDYITPLDTTTVQTAGGGCVIVTTNTNGSITINSSGCAGGGGGPITSTSTFWIQNTLTPTTTTQKFFVQTADISSAAWVNGIQNNINTGIPLYPVLFDSGTQITSDGNILYGGGVVAGSTVSLFGMGVDSTTLFDLIVVKNASSSFGSIGFQGNPTPNIAIQNSTTFYENVSLDNSRWTPTQLSQTYLAPSISTDVLSSPLSAGGPNGTLISGSSYLSEVSTPSLILGWSLALGPAYIFTGDTTTVIAITGWQDQGYNSFLMGSIASQYPNVMNSNLYFGFSPSQIDLSNPLDLSVINLGGTSYGGPTWIMISNESGSNAITMVDDNTHAVFLDSAGCWNWDDGSKTCSASGGGSNILAGTGILFTGVSISTSIAVDPNFVILNQAYAGNVAQSTANFNIGNGEFTGASAGITATNDRTIWLNADPSADGGAVFNFGTGAFSSLALGNYFGGSVSSSYRGNVLDLRIDNSVDHFLIDYNGNLVMGSVNSSTSYKINGQMASLEYSINIASVDFTNGNNQQLHLSTGANVITLKNGLNGGLYNLFLDGAAGPPVATVTWGANVTWANSLSAFQVQPNNNRNIVSCIFEGDSSTYYCWYSTGASTGGAGTLTSVVGGTDIIATTVGSTVTVNLSTPTVILSTPTYITTEVFNISSATISTFTATVGTITFISADNVVATGTISSKLIYVSTTDPVNFTTDFTQGNNFYVYFSTQASESMHIVAPLNDGQWISITFKQPSSGTGCSTTFPANFNWPNSLPMVFTATNNAADRVICQYVVGKEGTPRYNCMFDNNFPS